MVRIYQTVLINIELPNTYGKLLMFEICILFDYKFVTSILLNINATYPKDVPTSIEVCQNKRILRASATTVFT